MEKLPKIPENADKLTEPASVEVMCSALPGVDMLSFFNQNGYNVVSSDDEKAANPSVFVYDKSKSLLCTPFMNPEEVLPFMQDLSQKFEQNKIGYAPFKTKYKDQFLAPKSENLPEISSDEEVLKHLLKHKLEKRSMEYFLGHDGLDENIGEKGPIKLYRGTSMGDAAYTTISDGSRAFVYATPKMSTALNYAHMDTTSRFGFVEEYQASENQMYSHDGGLEMNSYNPNIDWKDLRKASYEANETFVEKETNPHLKTYLYDRKTHMMFTIYENGKYVDKFLQQYAKSRKPQKNYWNDNISKRVENVINSERGSEENQNGGRFFDRVSKLFSKDKQETRPKVKNEKVVQKLAYLRGSSSTMGSEPVMQKAEVLRSLILAKLKRSK